MSDSKESTLVKRRSKGERTRNQILTAAIKVLALNGIKGTTHRAVATEANIQLSLTTYYFKDIQQLIHEAFKLSSQLTIELADKAWEDAFVSIESIGKANLRKIAVREQLCEQLSERAAQYLLSKITEQPVALAVEQLLFTEIQITPELRELAQNYRQMLLKPFIRLCQYFNKHNAHIDADIMLTVFTQLEYRHLCVPAAEVDIALLRTVTRRIVAWVMGLKG